MITHIDWPRICWVYGMLVPAVLFAPFAATPTSVAVGLGLAFTTVCFGHTVGLHRGIIHRSYATSRVLRNFLAFVFVLTGLGGPLSWYRAHFLRDHHQSRPYAPPEIRFGGGLWADWVRTHHRRIQVEDWGATGVREEDLRDPWLCALERYWWAIQLVQAALLLAFGGWELLVVAGFGRNALVIFGHWFVGYIAHTHGTLRYRIDGACEEGRNTWLLGVLSLGEGFHNNHHAAPSSARLGRTPWEVDLGWFALVTLEGLGLVWDVRRPRAIDDLLKPGARLADREAPEKAGIRRGTGIVVDGGAEGA